MSREVSSIWKKSPRDFMLSLEACLDGEQNEANQEKKKTIYFRADDIAVPSKNFSRLTSLFNRYRIPLCLAVVPAWLTDDRWSSIKSLTRADEKLWCWHQHGWRHVSHSIKGKKCEFGPDRALYQIHNDLVKGMIRLKKIIGENFYPVFTPPWNRCDDNTLDILNRLKYKAVSRHFTINSGDGEKITGYDVHVDLHTRKEKDPETGWSNLLGEFRKALANGMCGIMIHHQLMNDHAFHFMDHLFKILTKKNNLRLVHFKDLEND